MTEKALSETDSAKINILLHEYNALKSEIASTLETSRQMLNLTFTLFGLFIAGFPFITDLVIQLNIRQIILVSPILFYLIAWSQIRYIMLVLDMGTYLREHTVAKLNRYLGNDLALSWEDKGRSQLKRAKWSAALVIPIAGSHFAVPILAAIAPLLGYFVFMSNNGLTLNVLDYVLIFLNIVAFVYSVFWGFYVETQR